jgi:hypothetical protein
MATFNIYRNNGIVTFVEAAAFNIDDGNIFFVDKDHTNIWVVASGSWLDIELDGSQPDSSEHSER